MNQFKDMLSQLKPYSLGIVVVDKPETSDVIQVFPSEQLPFAEGDLSKNKRMQISASWIRIGDSNRFTSPDVYKGETVQIYRYANTEEYFWSDIMREPSLRKKERVIYAISNVPGKSDVQSLDKSYYLEMSTKDKRIHLHTADNDGELCTYDVVLDTVKGNLTILDGMGNIITLDSKPGNLNFKLNGSLYGDVEKNINLKCTDANLKASGNIVANAGSDITLTAGNKISLNSPIIEFNGSRVITIKSSSIETEASNKISNKAPEIKSVATTTMDIVAPIMNLQATTKINIAAPDVKTSASNTIEHRARVIRTDDLEVTGNIRYNGDIQRGQLS